MSLLTGKLVAFGKLSFIQVRKGISPWCMIYYWGQMITSLRSAPPLEGLRDYSFDQSVMLLSRIGAMSGRVKMSKFLLTVCAFGLLLSFAFAEEKSPEQHREESNQIGLQKMNWTRVVASGTNQRIGFFYAVNPDCSASGDINIRITKQPEHGTAETAAATSFPNFERENIRYRCNQHEVRGQQLNYKSAEKYIGSDTLELLVLLPGGFAQEVHINIDVR